MKDGDYINILAPMKSKLKLKGNALMLFALIHGYSKDGKNTCRATWKVPNSTRLTKRTIPT